MWFLIAVFVATLVLAYAFMPRPQTQPPPSTSDVKAPTAEVGREIAVLFGTRDVEGANWVWWGDVRLIPIKAKGGKK